MKIEVDRDLCEGNALCVRAAPEVFRVDDQDFVELIVAEPPAELQAKVREAVRRCPRGALSIADE